MKLRIDKKNSQPFLCLLFSIIIISIICFNSLPAFGLDNDEENDDIGFYVSAVIPDNQIDKGVTYFDLKVSPSHQQTLQVEVTNKNDTKLTVDVSTISASTNRNGIIDYITPDIKDETLLYPFAEIATAVDDNVTIPANSTKIIKVDITMPKNVYDGVILGGIVITKPHDSPDSSIAADSTSTSIGSNYSYVVGVKLTETDTEILPNFELLTIEPGIVEAGAAIEYSLRNTEASIVKNLDINLTITNLDNDSQYLALESAVDMAPNSVFPLTVYPDQVVFEEGEYLSNLVLTLEDKIWEFEKTFSIKASEANKINNSLTRITTAANSSASYSIFIILLIIIILILLILLFFKRRKKEDFINNHAAKNINTARNGRIEDEDER